MVRAVRVYFPNFGNKSLLLGVLIFMLETLYSHSKVVHAQSLFKNNRYNFSGAILNLKMTMQGWKKLLQIKTKDRIFTDLSCF